MWGVRGEEVGDIWWSEPIESFIGDSEDLVYDPFWDGQSVEFVEDRGYTVKFPGMRGQLCSTNLAYLEPI